MVSDLGTLDEIIPLLDQRLSRKILGMGLASEDQLHGTLRIREQPNEPLGIVQQEIGALIRCEAARESDRERVLFEDVRDVQMGVAFG